MKLKMIFGGLVLLLVVLFTFQNTTIVEIKFLFWTFTLSRALLIYLVLFAGMILGWTIHAFMQHAKKKKAHQKESAHHEPKLDAKAAHGDTDAIEVPKSSND